jgi:hypothetical protein
MASKDRTLMKRLALLMLAALGLASPGLAGVFGIPGVDHAQEAKAPAYRLAPRINFTLGREHVLYDGDEVRGDLVPAGDRHPQIFGSPNERLVVIFVHGLHPMFLDGHWANPLQGNAALPWKAFSTALAMRFAKGKYPTWDTEFFYWGYRPTRPYPELAREFASVVEAVLPGRRLVLVTHSAGALIPRFARGQGLLPDLEAVIGVGPAHGGVQGASMILADDSIEELFLGDPGRFGPGYVGADGRPRHRFMDTIRGTRAEFLPTRPEEVGSKIPVEVMASSVWGNEDGGFSDEEIRRYRIPIQELPTIDYLRYDHLGAYRPTASPPRGGPDGRPAMDGTFELLGSWFHGWKRNDSGVTEYDPSPARSWRYAQETGFLPMDGSEHVGLVFNTELVGRVLDQVQAIARRETPER